MELTQIRVGVMRPEIIVPGYEGEGESASDDRYLSEGLVIGTPVKLLESLISGCLLRL